MNLAESMQIGRALAGHVWSNPRGRLAIAGGMLLLVLLAVGFGLRRGRGGSTSRGKPVQPIVMVACQRCGFNEPMTRSALRQLQHAPNGMLVCPQCGRPTADRFRAGGTRVMQIHVPTSADDTPASSDP